MAGKKEDFFLVGVLYEASVIDQEIGKKGKPILFELSIGECYNYMCEIMWTQLTFEYLAKMYNL